MSILKIKKYLHRLSYNKFSFIKKSKRKLQKRFFSLKIYSKILNKKKRFLKYKHIFKKIHPRFLNRKKFNFFKIVNLKTTNNLPSILNNKYNQLLIINKKLLVLRKFKQKIQRLKNTKKKIFIYKALIKIGQLLSDKKKNY